MNRAVLDEEKWSRIAKELPSSASPRAFRAHLEAYLEGYSTHGNADAFMLERKNLKVKNRVIAEAAQTLLDTYDLGMAWRPGVNIQEIVKRHEALSATLREIVENAERNLRQLEHSGPKRTRPRNQLLNLALTLWVERGGKLTTVTDYNGKAIGPVERYVVAVAAAAGHTMTPDAARAVIRKRRAMV